MSDAASGPGAGPGGIERPILPNEPGDYWGSDAVALMLREVKLPYVALNPGASYRGLHDSLVNLLGNREPQMLLCLHEEHAVAIAHGYAKVSGRPMGAIVHSNVGLMHATMAMFNAWCDRVPVFVLGATGPVDAAKRRPWIDWIHTAQDQGALIRNFTKWDDQPASVPAAAESVLRAYRMMTTPPCGPVYICLDAALQESRIGALPALPSAARFRPPRAAAPDPASVGEAAALLQGAERPLILVGPHLARRGGMGAARPARRGAGRDRADRRQDRRWLPVAPQIARAPRRQQPERGGLHPDPRGRRDPQPRLGRSCRRTEGRLWHRTGRRQGRPRLARPPRAQRLEHGLPGPAADRPAPRGRAGHRRRGAAAAVEAAAARLGRLLDFLAADAGWPPPTRSLPWPWPRR